MGISASVGVSNLNQLVSLQTDCVSGGVWETYIAMVSCTSSLKVSASGGRDDDDDAATDPPRTRLRLLGGALPRANPPR